MALLDAKELEFYRRHVSLPEVGLAGQEKLKSSSVLIVGLGGLGSPLSLYLAAAGVGRIGVVEFDLVDATNLHRQILYSAAQVGIPKIEAGSERLRQLNPHIRVETHPVRLDRSNARSVIRGYDVVADGADNFPTRYLVNDACVLERRPLVSASILSFEGQLSVFGWGSGAERGPCYRCLYPEPPAPGSVPSCAEGGVLGVLPGVMGALQAAEVLKVLLGIGEVASGRLLTYDALALEFTKLSFKRSAACPVCGDRPTIHELIDYERFCAAPSGENAMSTSIPQVSVTDLAEKLKKSDRDFILVDVREADERQICKIDAAIHVPLADILENRWNPPAGKALMMQCRSGKRSQMAAEHLAAKGVKNVSNVAGGILAWIEKVDPTLKSY